MKREIKFRIVNGTIICAYEYLSDTGWKHVLLNTGAEHDGTFDDKFWGHEKACIRNQFTGLLDIKKKEIYEGDIVKNINEESEAFGQTANVCWHKTIGGFTLLFEAIGSDKMLGMYSQLEIIGNIYENKESLSI